MGNEHCSAAAIFIHSFIPSFVLSLIGSSVHSFKLTRYCMRSPTHYYIHAPSARSFMHPTTHTLNQPPCSLNHSLTHSLAHSRTHPLTQSLTPSLACSRIHALVPPQTRPLTLSFTYPLKHPPTHPPTVSIQLGLGQHLASCVSVPLGR